MKKLLLLLATACLIKITSAQTSSGNCFSMPTNGSAIIDCGNSNSFNTGNALTLEVWIRPFSVDNQKIMGKVTWLGGAKPIADGYIFGMDGAMYPQVYCTDGTNEAGYGLNNGTIPADSVWVHLAMTYSSADYLSAYINGVLAGQTPTTASPNGLISSTTDFFIANAPWATTPSLETFGYLDEVRVWNTELTQQQLQANMFKHLQGTEPGLIAYYDFNSASGTTVPDVTGQGNTGTLTGTGGSFVGSYAAVGDDSMYNMNSVQGIWYGKGGTTYNYGITKGLTIVGNIQAKHFDYAVLGCDTTVTGTSVAYLPVNAPSGFTRLTREWYVNVGGTVEATNMYFNLANAGGSALVNGFSAGDYTLLSRTNTNQPYTAIASGAVLTGNVIQFNNIPLNNKTYYTVGVSQTNLHLGVNNIPASVQPITVYPNPASSSVTITNVAGAQINIYDNLGRLIKSVKQDGLIYNMDVSDIANGAYYIQVLNGNNISQQKLIIQK